MSDRHCQNLSQIDCPKDISGSVPKSMSDRLPEDMSDPQYMSDRMSEYTLDRHSECMSNHVKKKNQIYIT